MGDLLAPEQLLEHLNRPLLAAEDVSGFGREAFALVAEFQSYGWRGFTSNRGHVILHAPDGATTCSVGRTYNGRTGRNAEAVLKRWKREHLPLRHELETRISQVAEQLEALVVKPSVKPAGAFGQAKTEAELTDRLVDPHGRVLPIPTQVSLKKHADQLLSFMGPEFDEAGFIVVEDTRPLAWVFGKVFEDPMRPIVIGPYGPDLPDELAALEWACKIAAPVRAAHERYLAAVSQSADTTLEDDVKMYPCATCGETFPTAILMARHTNTAHSVVAVCPVCDKEFKNASAMGLHKLRAHAEPVACERCGKMIAGGPASMAVHNKWHTTTDEKAAAKAAANAARVVTPDVTPDTVDVTPVEPGLPQPGQDVLADHLMSVPQGADAESTVAKIRAIVAAPLVAEVMRLRTERDELAARCDLLVKEKEDTEARLSILREALAL